MTPPERSARRPLDATALARVQRRLLQADRAPWLHGEVARRMAERLPVIRLRPERIVDWGAFLGALIVSVVSLLLSAVLRTK